MPLTSVRSCGHRQGRARHPKPSATGFSTPRRPPGLDFDPILLGEGRRVRGAAGFSRSVTISVLAAVRRLCAPKGTGAVSVTGRALEPTADATGPVDKGVLCELAGEPASGAGCAAGRPPDAWRALAHGRIR